MSEEISDLQSVSDSFPSSTGVSNQYTHSEMNQHEVSDVDMNNNNEMKSERSNSGSTSDGYNHLGDQFHSDSKKEMSSPKSSQDNMKQSPDEDADEDARFVCNICLDPVKDAVVTVCGHLYCWPCLFRWLNIGHTSCPVCKAGVTKENVIPLYLQGNNEDPRSEYAERKCSFLVLQCVCVCGNDL
mmetsp:Transcript_22964/g.38866  ORF Transcript_22964/g.38866 Transcript_22964/m.38866 type:complete len:185 (-) Transcript_22964:501-1055(-)